jgi:hypothetical protein
VFNLAEISVSDIFIGTGNLVTRKTREFTIQVLDDNGDPISGRALLYYWASSLEFGVPDFAIVVGTPTSGESVEDPGATNAAQTALSGPGFLLTDTSGEVSIPIAMSDAPPGVFFLMVATESQVISTKGVYP